jgi:hypothetical protein
MTERDEKILLLALGGCIAVLIVGVIIGYLYELIHS